MERPERDVGSWGMGEGDGGAPELDRIFEGPASG